MAFTYDFSFIMAEQKMRSFDNWQESMRNFSWLLESVSGAMDVDCLIERKGNFLIVEGKPWSRGVRMPYGQHRALYQLSLQPNTRVYLVGEDKDDTIHVACYNNSPKPVYVKGKNLIFWPPDRFVPTTKDGLATIVQAWWKDAGDGNLGLPAE
jgi:hypothetical protein